MEDNIINIGNSTMIFNGGNPLEGCPKDWEEAKAIEERLNEGKEEFGQSLWHFDCGFKLDFDGPLLRISSRFYPPKTHYGATWDGTVTVMLLEKEIAKKKFDCTTLDELRKQVEEYVKGITEKIASLLPITQ